MASSKLSASPLSGFLAGALGGLLGTFALDVYQKAALEATRKAESLAGNGHKFTRQQESMLQGFAAAHADTAEAITRTSLTHQQRTVAAPITHYAFGALCGGLYGLLAEYVPATTSGFGTAFGTAVFALGQEAAVPAFGLSPAPTEIPPLLHIGGLTAHAVYGATTEGTRLLLRKLL